MDRSRHAESILALRVFFFFFVLAFSMMIVVAPDLTIVPSRFSNFSSFSLYDAEDALAPSRMRAMI